MLQSGGGGGSSKAKNDISEGPFSVWRPWCRCLRPLGNSWRQPGHLLGRAPQPQRLSPLAPRGPSYGLQPGLALTRWITSDTSPHISGPQCLIWEMGVSIPPLEGYYKNEIKCDRLLGSSLLYKVTARQRDAKGPSFFVVQLLSRVTVCRPMDCSTPGDGSLSPTPGACSDSHLSSR